MHCASALSSPFALPRGSTLANRLVMAPMTTCTGFHDGSVTEDVINYYRQRANGLGAVIVESCFIDKQGPAFPGALGIDSDDKIPGLAQIASAIKAQGAKAIIQIYHGGRMVDPALIGGKTPVGPSAVAAPREGAATPQELSAAEIETLIQQFADAVHRSIQAGFDGVEIHGANTYLIQQFFSPHSNRRTDQWGGSREKRATFPLAILDVTHQQAQRYAAADFIIGYRFSPEEIEEPGIRFADSVFLLEKLAERGLDYVHFSMGHILRPSLCNTEDPTPLITQYCQMRSATLAQVPVIGVGDIVNLSDAQLALESGYDLVAGGRACIAHPNWAEKILQQGETLALSIDQSQREALSIPLPLWQFSPVESMIRDTSLLSKKYKPGLYQEFLQDESGELQISTHIDQNGITDILLESHQGYGDDFNQYFDSLREKILEANSPHVDAITGATTQCEQIKKVIIKALNKSVKAAQEEEGIDTSVFPQYDIVVVGSGGGGLAAAIQASENGARVMLIEKMASLGGNTFKASAGMNAAGTRFQREKGIIDDKELFFEETLKGGKYKNNVELLRYLVDNAPLAIDWLADHNIILNDITATGGMSVERAHRPADGSSVGGYLIKGLVNNVTQRPIDILTDTAVTDIHLQEGKVSHVTILNDGVEREIPTHAVIVASGGFSANKTMVESYRPDLENFVTTNHKGATGKGIGMLTRVGATVVDMDQIQIHPTVEQASSYLISESIRGGGAILIGHDGRRFVNEMGTRDHVSEAIIAQPGSNALLIFNDAIRTSNKAVEEYIRRNLVTESASLADLAAHWGIDPAVLAKTFERYNTFVEQGLDDDFGRQTALRHPFLEGRFYSIQIAPGIHHTMGGVVINTHTEVLNAEGQPIPGVYAAGEVVGGIHGANRIGGNAVADVIVFGIQSGKSAALYAKQVQ